MSSLQHCPALQSWERGGRRGRRGSSLGWRTAEQTEQREGDRRGEKPWVFLLNVPRNLSKPINLWPLAFQALWVLSFSERGKEMSCFNWNLRPTLHQKWTSSTSEKGLRSGTTLHWPSHWLRTEGSGDPSCWVSYPILWNHFSVTWGWYDWQAAWCGMTSYSIMSESFFFNFQSKKNKIHTETLFQHREVSVEWRHRRYWHKLFATFAIHT